MKKTLLLSLSILSVFFFSTISNAQVTEQWIAKYSYEGMDQAKSMVLDPFGNIYVAGTSFSSSTGTYWGVLIKYNPAGEQRWAARFNGSTGGANGVAAYTPIVTDASGNVYVTGQSYDATGYYITTIKYDSSGTEQWTAKYSGGAPSAITIDNAGNIYVTGTENVAGHWSDYITIKYDANGVEQWVALYDGPAHYVDDATAIAADNQGNIYVTGYSWVGSNWDYTTVKYNADGIQQWVTNYNGTRSASSSVDIPEAIALAIDMAGNIYIYVTGTSEGYGTTIDYLTIKYDATGVMQWDARYNGPGNFFDGATAIAIDKYGNSYVTGYSTAADGSYEFATIKYTSNGGEEWIARYGTGYANAIALDDEGNVYVTGAYWDNGSGFLTVKYDNAGTQQWTKSFTGDGYGNDGAVSIAISKNENCQYIYVTGTSNQNGTEKNISTIKYTEADVLASATAVCIGSGVSFSDNTNHAATGWEWTFQGGTPSSSTEQNPTVTYATAGTYDVTLTSYSATGCRSITKHQYITVNENPLALITASGPTSFCSGGSVELVSNEANSYLWSNGATTQNIMVTDAGSYTLTTEGGGGCAGTATSAPVTVNIKNQVATITSSGAPVICDTNTLTLTTNIEGASYYWWPTGDTTQSITINSPGDYSLDITDTSGCYSYAFISINGGATPYVFIDAPLTFLCPGGDPVYLSAFTDFNNTIQWSNGAIDPFIMATDVGKYTVTATSPEGCSASDSVTITGLGVPQITASNTVLCDGSTISLTASPNDEANYMYYWSNGETTASINISLPDMYWVNVQDIMSGCMASSDPIMINSVPVPAPLADAGQDATLFPGKSTTIGTFFEPGNIYNWSPSAGLDDPSIATPTASPSVTTTYTLTVSNDAGCIASDTVTIEVINLGAASSFAILSGNNISASDTVFANGKAGASGTITNLIASDSLLPHNGGSVATARANIMQFYNYADGLQGTPIPSELGGQSLVPGIYDVGSAATMNGTLSLTGDASSFYMFKMNGLTVNQNAVLDLGDVLPENIYWYSSADITINENTDFSGIIFSKSDITRNGGNFGKTALLADGNIAFYNQSLDNPEILFSQQGLIIMSSPGYTNPFTFYKNLDTQYDYDCAGYCESVPNCNLVRNSGFECYKETPSYPERGIGQIHFACPWKEINRTSPDFYHENATGPNASLVDVPKNNMGNEQGHNSSKGYAGLFTYMLGSSDHREYLKQQLKTPLIPGVEYRIEMWVSLAERSRYATNLGLYLTDEDIVFHNYQPFLDIVNGVPKTNMYLLNSNFITNTNGWTLIEGTFTPTVAGIQYLYVGKFNDITNVLLINNPNAQTSPENSAYYFIDDILIEPVTPTAITLSPNVDICYGNSTKLTASGANSYSWSPSTGLNTTTGSTVTANPTTTTTYTVIGTDVNGCKSDPKTVTVNVRSLPVVTVSANPTVICLGNASTLTANGAYSYKWSPSTGLSSTTGATITANPTSTNTYTVIGTDANGCIGLPSSVTVTVKPSPTVSITPSSSTSFCKGSNVTLTATGATTYTWAPSDGLSYATSTSVTASPTVTTTYTLTGTNTDGCSNSATVTITIYPTPLVDAGYDQITCSGNSVNLGGFFPINSPYTYSWAPATGLSCTTCEHPTATPSGSTSYTITATGNNGCTAFDNIFITVNPLPTVDAGDDQDVCNAYGNSLFGGNPSASGGTWPYTYLWTPATGLSNPTVANPEIFLYNGGSTPTITNYTLTVTDLYGCKSNAQVKITVNPLPATPIVTANGSTTFCKNENVTLTSSAANAYLWSTGATTQSITVAASGNYSVTITDANNCSATSATTVVTVKPLPIVNITASATVVCENEMVRLTADGADSYSWLIDNLPPNISKDMQFGGLAGLHTIRVTGTNTASGCTNTSSVTITVRPSPVLTTSSTDPTCNNGTDGTATVTATGGTAPYTYSWNTTPIQTTASASNLSSGDYTVNVTDANGCIATESVHLNNPAPLMATITDNSPNAPCPNFGAMGTITANPSGTGITYLWSTGETTQSIWATFRHGVQTTGIYSVWVTDANGCTGQATISLNGLDITTSNGTNTFCSGENATLTATSASPYAIYRWSTGATTQSIDVSTSGIYHVYAGDPLGCHGIYFPSTIILNTVSCTTDKPDLAIDISGTQVAKSYACDVSTPICTSCVHKVYRVTYKNYGTTTNACTVSLTLPENVRYVSTINNTPPPDNIILGQQTELRWTKLCNTGFAQNLVGNDLYILTEIYDSSPTCTTIPQTLTATASIEPLDDGDPTNNSFTEHQPFNGPFDPNNKMLMWPQGKGLCNTIHSNDTLIYQINFQNVGTKAATIVVLMDTIDTQTLDIASIKVLQTSHPGVFSIEENTLIWTFNDINLPDSTSDLAGSVGFVKYSIRPMQGIAPSTVINNKAAIYFDSNEPVITNTVSNTILGLPVTIAASGTTPFCQGDSVVLTASAANSYLWNTGDTTQSIIVKAPGKYSVIDASKCLANSDSITITVNPLPLANAGADQTLYLGYGPQSVDLSASTSGGTTPYAYSWNTGAFTQNITVKPVVSTTYEVTVTDANGCSANDAVLVNVIDVRYCKEEKSKGKDNGKGREQEECKIIICHRDKKHAKEGSKNESKGGNNGTGEDAFDVTQYQTLIVDKNAVAAHLAHGDYLGSCAIVATKKGEEEIAASAVSTAKTTGTQLENFPNPFSTLTTIRFSVPATTPVKLEIYGITGKLLETVFEGTVEENKSYSITYDAKELPPGIYLYRLSSGIEICNKKMLIVR